MTQTETFEKIKKRFALNNSYFKNRRPQDPSTPFEVFDYLKQHGELPYNVPANSEWLYDCFSEFQKRGGVQNQQFFTPTGTAKRMVEISKDYTNSDDVQVLDACCGFGQITNQLLKFGYENIFAFDNDKNMVDLMWSIHEQVSTTKQDYTEISRLQQFQFIISNPPYDGKDLTAFFEFLSNQLCHNGIAVLLIPLGFLDKSRPEKLVKLLNKFGILHREPMIEKFERTNAVAEIVVLQLL
jgi:predicted RNA methylase